MCMNKEGTGKYFSIPQLDEGSYRATYDTQGEWIQHNLYAPPRVFNRDNELYNHMPYNNIK